MSDPGTVIYCQHSDVGAWRQQFSKLCLILERAGFDRWSCPPDRGLGSTAQSGDLNCDFRRQVVELEVVGGFLRFYFTNSNYPQVYLRVGFALANANGWPGIPKGVWELETNVEFDLPTLEIALTQPNRFQFGPAIVCSFYNLFSWIFNEVGFDLMVAGSNASLYSFERIENYGVRLAFRFDRHGKCLLVKQFEKGFGDGELDVGHNRSKIIDGVCVFDVMEYSSVPIPVPYRESKIEFGI